MSDNVSNSVVEGLSGNQESEDSIQERLSDLKKKAAQMASSKKAMKREEGHARKNEQKIIDLLLKFLNSKNEDRVIMAVLNALGKNISSNIVVHSLLLLYENLFSDLDFENFEGEEFSHLKEGLSNMKQLSAGQSENLDRAIINVQGSGSLAPELKLKLGLWMESLYEISLIYPHRTLETFKNESAQEAFKYLLEEILWQFFSINRVNIEKQSDLSELIDNIFINLLDRITSSLENVKYIEEVHE